MVEAPRKIEQAADGLGQLKALLFQGEARRLEKIERELGRLDGRVGDAYGLEKATTEIIVEALRGVEVARHRELAEAIAPVVVAAIHSEIRNSRAMMVEALYPLTGQLVVAAVQNAFRELVASINQRLDALTSVDRWKLQMRSRLTGRPVSELAMEQAGRGRIVRIFFLESGSGRLIESWRADEREDERADMVSGLIAALTGFAREALDAGANELRTLDFGGRKTFLRNSPQTIVAAEIEGDLTREQIFALDQAFLTLIEDYGRDGAVNDGSLRAFAARVHEAAPKASRKGAGLPLKIVAASLLLLLGAWSWRSGARWWQERQIEGAVGEVVASRPQLGAFPIRIATDHAARRVELYGLVPGAADADALANAIKTPAGDYMISTHFAVMPAAPAVDALEQRQTAAQRDTDAVRRELAAAGERAAALDRQLASAREILDGLARSSASSAQLSGLQQQLERLANAGASAAQVMELQARVEAMVRAGASASQVDDLRNRVEAVAGAGASAGLVADLRTRIDTLAATGAETRRLNDSVAKLADQLAAVTAKFETPRARLAGLIDGFAIFFGEGERPLNEAPAAARLAAIADLIKARDLGIRVVGHADATGSAAQNQLLSRRRAEFVADLLVAKGVDRSKIVVAARSASFLIAEQPSARERNRRVTLENLFEDEVYP